MDVWEQLLKFETEFRERSAVTPTKLTLGRDLAEWLIERWREQIKNPELDASNATLFGIPVVVDDEFWPGQLRIHRGEEFEDRFVIMPPCYPRLELRASETVSWRHEFFAAAARPYVTPPDWGASWAV